MIGQMNLKLISFYFYILNIDISFTIHAIDPTFLFGFSGFLLREECRKFYIYVLVFILCQKTGNILSFFNMKNSTFHKTKTRA